MARILLIDDDELLLETLRQMLLRDGHDVEAVSDGVVAMARVAEPGWDLVVTDVMMPRVDGAQVIAALRRSHPNVPVIAMSGGVGEADAARALRGAALAGASARLQKPFRRQQLRDAVAAALGATGTPEPAD